MDPISIALGLGGLGLSLFGGMGQAGIAKQQAQISSQIAGISQGVAQDELQIQSQKQLQVQLESNRMKLQNYRNVQQARALDLANATSSGAEFGSGLKGSQAAASNQGLQNELGINQALSINNAIYGLDTDIGQKRIQMAGLQSQSALLGGQAATDQGYASLGGALMKSGPIIGSFAKDFIPGYSGWSSRLGA